MKKTRFTEEQMVTILREADQRPAPEIAKKHGVCAASTTFAGGRSNCLRASESHAGFKTCSVGRLPYGCIASTASTRPARSSAPSSSAATTNGSSNDWIIGHRPSPGGSYSRRPNLGRSPV